MDSVTGIKVPAGVDDSKWRKDMRSKFGIHCAGGQGDMKGQMVRFNHMGYVDEVDTLGGLVFLLAGHIPAKGECVTHMSGWKFEAVDSDPRRIIRVRRVENLTGRNPERTVSVEVAILRGGEHRPHLSRGGLSAKNV